MDQMKWAGWYLLAMASAAGPATAAPSAPFAATSAPLSIEDRGLRIELSDALSLGPDRLASGRVELIRQTESSASTLILLLDGTEIGRMQGAKAGEFLADHPGIRSALSDAPAYRGEATASGASTWPAAFLAHGDWLRLGRWEEGVTAGYRVDYLFSGVLVRRNRVGGGFRKRIKGIYVGVDLAYTSFKGELPDSLPHAAKAGPLGWGMELGFDFLRYRLGRAPLALPEYFWAEKDLEEKYFDRKTGGDGATLVRIFDASAEPAWEHEVHVKAGALRYSLAFAPEAYKSPLHTLALDDLPGVLGTWGMGALLVPEGFIPGGWYRFEPVTLARIDIGGRAHPIRFGAGRITYFRSVRNHFSLAWTGELRMEL